MWFGVIVIIVIIGYALSSNAYIKRQQREKGRYDAISAYNLTGVVPKIPKSDSKDYLEGFNIGLKEIKDTIKDDE